MQYGFLFPFFSMFSSPTFKLDRYESCKDSKGKNKLPLIFKSLMFNDVNMIFLFSCFDILRNSPRVGEFVWKCLSQGEKTDQI